MRPYLAYGFRQASDDACSLSKVVQFFQATNRAFVRQFAPPSSLPLAGLGGYSGW